MSCIMVYTHRDIASEKGPVVAKHKRPHYSSSLAGRIQQAMAEQRFQHALELARQQFKQEPTPAHRQLVFSAALGRARQLREQGATRDAATMLRGQLDGLTDAMKPQVAEELALCGEAQAALGL